MKRFARHIVEHPRLWIGAWLLAATVIGLPAPRIPTLLQDDAKGFLPADMPSQRALAKLRVEFPESASASRCALIFARDAGLTDADRAYAAAIARALYDRSAELNWQVRAVGLAPYLRPILESLDGRATVVAVDLPAEMLTHSSVRRVREVKNELSRRSSPDGLQIELTGNAAMGELLDANSKKDVDRTTLWAVGAVIVILLFIYRSPIAMFLPLVTIGVALLVGRGIVGWAAAWGWPINGLVEMFIIVMVVGAGVDYCLFLFARFKEESAAGVDDPASAIEAALVHSGPAILASAGTVAVGLATLILARNRDLHTSGPTIAFTIVVATLAVLTLTPALMRIAGKRLLSLKPNVAPPLVGGALWRMAARLTTHHPVAVAVAILALLIPAGVLGSRVPSLYDTYDEYPADSSFVRGARLYRKHFFDSKSVSEMTLLIDSAKPLDDRLDAFAAALRIELPVAYQRDLRDPLGLTRSGGASTLPASLVERLARQTYVGKNGTTLRIDLGLFAEPRSVEAMAQVERVREVAEYVFGSGVEIAGEPAVYRDMRDLRVRDFRVVAAAATALIYLVLLALIRAPLQALILLSATLLTYFATYGVTYLVVHAAFGLNGLSWQIHFLLFIIIMSLGQDYNIFVVARIHEELRTRPPREAIDIAIRKTGKVVSSCGIIMAATFASMFSGSLLVLKEFAIALPLGILMDTFLVRPLLVPALILLLTEWREKSSSSARNPPSSTL